MSSIARPSRLPGRAEPVQVRWHSGSGRDCMACFGELPPDLQGSGERRLTSDSAGSRHSRLGQARPEPDAGIPHVRICAGGAASNGRPYRELIGRAGATCSSRATLPVATSSQGREVGGHQSCPRGAGRAPAFCKKCGVPYAAATESRRPIARNTPSSVASLGLPASLSVR